MYKAYRDADTGEPAAFPLVVSDLTIMFLAGMLNIPFWRDVWTTADAKQAQRPPR